MILDIDIIKTFYQSLPRRMGEVRKAAGRPLTLTENILINHLCSPDRIAMQDATAQMALIQFMGTG